MEMKIGDLVNVHYRGQQRTAKVVKKATKRSQRRGELWWWLEVNDQEKKDLDKYYWRFMQADRILQNCQCDDQS